MNIDKDTFEYEGGFRQCISGFGRNAKEAVEELLNHRHSDAGHNRVNWHIDELVRWCQELNGELQTAQFHLADFITRLPAHSDACGCETCELRSYIEREMGVKA